LVREATLDLLVGHLVGTTLELVVVVVLSVVVVLLRRTSGLVLVGSLSELLLLLRVLVVLRRASVGSHIITSLLVLEFWLNKADELLEDSKHLWFLE